jgi:threonine synthase
VVARAWGRPLSVFVPSGANEAVLDRLHELGAGVSIERRLPGVPGDPAVRALRRALAGGAIAFTCQGTDNGLALEGGLTLGYELAEDVGAAHGRLDRLFIQVGGGALASSVAQALDEAVAFGVLDRMPRIHAVQTSGSRPLARAYGRVVARLARLFDGGLREVTAAVGRPDATPWERRTTADALRLIVGTPRGAAELARAAHHRSAYMWPWEDEPRSIATGIVDDETYDWFAVVTAMLRTGGYPVTASEAHLREANVLGRETTGIDVDHTGTAGLAGLIALRRSGEVAPDESVAVLFTGVRRAVPPAPSTPRSTHTRGRP